MGKIRRVHRWMTVAVFVLIGAVMLFPFVFILMGSLMSEAEILSRYGEGILPSNVMDTMFGRKHYAHFTFLPDVPTGRQYVDLFFFRPAILQMYLNSLMLSIPALGVCIIAAPAAYAFEQMKWKHKEKIYFVYLVAMLLPLQVTLVPHFIVARALKIDNSYLSIILPALFSPFATFLIRQHIKGMSSQVWEAAQIDGAGHVVFFLHVALPGAIPAIAACTILIFAESWNMVDQAVVMIKESYRMPLSVYLGQMMAQTPSSAFAASVLYVIPPLLLFVWCGPYLQRSIQLTGFNK